MTINAGEFLIAFVAAMGIPSAIMGLIVWKLERKIAARDKRAEEQEEAQKDFFLLMVQSTGAAIALGEATAKAVFALIAAVITVIVIPYIKSKTTAQQQAEINAWVKIAVSAAEQIYNGSGRGPEKKAYVLEWLKQRGITVDEAKLDAMIESAVYELKSGVLAVGELSTSGGDET